MDVETKKRIGDYFEGFELVEYLQLTIEQVIEAFEDEIEENIDDIEEFIGVRQTEEDSE